MAHAADDIIVSASNKNSKEASNCKVRLAAYPTPRPSIHTENSRNQLNDDELGFGSKMSIFSACDACLDSDFKVGRLGVG